MVQVRLRAGWRMSHMEELGHRAQPLPLMEHRQRVAQGSSMLYGAPDRFPRKAKSARLSILQLHE